VSHGNSLGKPEDVDSIKNRVTNSDKDKKLEQSEGDEKAGNGSDSKRSAKEQLELKNPAAKGSKIGVGKQETKREGNRDVHCLGEGAVRKTISGKDREQNDK